MKAWINFAGYQIAWLVTVLGAARGDIWPGIVCCLIFAAWQLRASPWRGADLRLVGGAVLAGLLLDGALGHIGLVQYAAPTPGWPAPVWILAIWGAFGLTLNHSLAFVRPPLAALMGAIGGPLAYLAAARVGAITLPHPLLGAALLAMEWSVVAWLMVSLARRWRGRSAHLPAPSGAR